MSMHPGPFTIDPELYDDTELGSEVRAAHARGSKVVVLLPQLCPRCFQSIRAQENCPACGDETDTCGQCGRELLASEGPLCAGCEERR